MPCVRLAKATGLQLLICVEHRVWGATRNRLRKWRTGDELVIIGAPDFIGLAEISGEPFTSEDLIFEGGFYPYRVPVEFKHIIGSTDVPDVAADIRKILADRYGNKNGWPILMQIGLPEEVGRLVATTVCSRANVLAEVRSNVTRLLEDAMPGNNL